MVSTKTPPRIQTLTPEQEALLPVIRDEWLAVGLSTAPADRPAAEEGVRLAYAAANLPPPQHYLWRGSPWAGALAAAQLAAGQDPDPHAPLSTELLQQIRDQVWQCSYGQHDAGWLAFHDAWGRFGLADIVAPLAGLMQVARSAGWWWPFDDAVILTERPCFLARDDDGRLHHPSRAALEYPDGWGIYAWHGVRVMPQVIEAPETLTVAQITDESNLAVRRVMLERFGWERYLRESGARIRHRDDWGTLHEVRFADDEPLVMVEVVNSTPEDDGSYVNYLLRVPPACATAHEAVAWTCGETAETYRPAVET